MATLGQVKAAAAHANGSVGAVNPEFAQAIAKAAAEVARGEDHANCSQSSNDIYPSTRALTKIARDIRLLHSGPDGGMGEIEMPTVLIGSPIMPGKTNPTVPELMLHAAEAVPRAGDAGYDAVLLEQRGNDS